MARKHQVTAAIRVLRSAGVTYREHHYEYAARSGAAGGAQQLALDPHRVIKTLILETSAGQPLCLLMHGDREVSLKRLARDLDVKAVAMAQPEKAQRYSGYLVGGTSPFGLRTEMPILCEETIEGLESIVVNGGKRGFLVEIAVTDMIDLLHPTFVAVAVGPQTR